MRSPFANLAIGDILVTAGTWEPATEFAALAAYHKAGERPLEIDEDELGRSAEEIAAIAGWQRKARGE